MDQTLGSDMRGFLRNRQNIKWSEGIGIALCLFGTFVAARANFSGRSLFGDEAMFVWSLENRSLADLAATPLVGNQTSPLVYLYAVKLLMLLFGDGEWVFRLPSLLSFVLLPLVVRWTAKHLFEVTDPWLCAGFCANLGVLLLYSDQAKPYMLEALLSLCVLVVHFTYPDFPYSKENAV